MFTDPKGIHVHTNQNGTGWVTSSNGTVLTRHRSKPAAIEEGRKTARRHGDQLTVHRKDGKIVSSQSYAISPLG